MASYHERSKTKIYAMYNTLYHMSILGIKLEDRGAEQYNLINLHVMGKASNMLVQSFLFCLNNLMFRIPFFNSLPKDKILDMTKLTTK